MPAYHNPSTTTCPIYCNCGSCISQSHQEDPSSMLFGVSLQQQHSLIEDANSLSQNFELSSSSSASCSPNVVPNSLQSEDLTGTQFHSAKYIFDCPPRIGTFAVDSVTTPPAFQLSDELKDYAEAYLRGRFEIPPGVEVGLHVLPSLPRRKTPAIMALICLAIWQSPEKRLSLQDIFEAVLQRFPSLDDGNCAWKRSIRHKLSLKAAFIKMRRPRGQASAKGCLWTFDASLGDADSPTRASRMRSKAQKSHRVSEGVRNSSPSSTSDISVDSLAHESTALQLTDLSFPEQWSTQSSNHYSSSQSYTSTVATFYTPPDAQQDVYMSYIQTSSASPMAYAPYQETAYPAYCSTVPSYAQEKYHEPRRPTKSQSRLSIQADGSSSSNPLARHNSGSSRYAPYESLSADLYLRSSDNRLISYQQ